MTQWIQSLVVKPEDPSSITDLRSTWQKERTNSYKLSSNLQVHTPGALKHSHTSLKQKTIPTHLRIRNLDRHGGTLPLVPALRKQKVSNIQAC